MDVRGAAPDGVQQQLVHVADDGRVFDVIARNALGFDVVAAAGDFKTVEFHALVVGDERRIGLGTFDGLVDKPLQLVFFDDDGIHAHACLELDLVDGVKVGGIGHAEEQALAAAEHWQYAMLGQQLVGNQPGDFQVDGQGVEVEQRNAEFAGCRFGDGPWFRDAGTHELGNEMGFLFPGSGERRNSGFLADDPVLHEALRQAGKPVAVANIGH